MTWLDCNTEKQGAKKVVAKLKYRVCTEFVDKSEAVRISVTNGLLEPTQYELATSVSIMHETINVPMQ